jgi:hypothetical protein
MSTESHNKYYQEYAARFAAASNQSLIESFNREVGNIGWTSVRASCIAALIDEFRNRDINISAVNDGDVSICVSEAGSAFFKDEPKLSVLFHTMINTNHIFIKSVIGAC